MSPPQAGAGFDRENACKYWCRNPDSNWGPTHYESYLTDMEDFSAIKYLARENAKTLIITAYRQLYRICPIATDYDGHLGYLHL
jgi:hypothetical protein